MAAISGYDSNSIATLFSGLNTGKRSGGTDMLGISYTDYATIRGGSYYKLMKAYYAGDETAQKIAKPSTSTSKDNTKVLARLEDKSDDLKDAADALLEKGSKSVFKQTSKTDEKGKTTASYDTEAIYKKVNAFVDSYNSMLDEAEDSNTKGVQNSVTSMIHTTGVNEKLLDKIGITIGKDNKLSIDKEVFAKADMSTVKSLFNTTGGYGYQVSAKASMINYYAESEAAKANTYGKNGTYTYNYATGDIYNSTM